MYIIMELKLSSNVCPEIELLTFKWWSHMQEEIRFSSNIDVSGKKGAIWEMIYCIGHTPVGKRKSEVETLIHVFEYFSISYLAYLRFRKDYELPIDSNGIQTHNHLVCKQTLNI